MEVGIEVRNRILGIGVVREIYGTNGSRKIKDKIYNKDDAKEI